MRIERLFRGRHAAAWIAAASLSLALTGCGDDGFGRRYRVMGTVTYKQQPLKEGTISFTPESATGRAASAMISDGAYSLTTVNPDDGALPGRYRVSITANDVDLSKAEAAAKAGGGAAYREDLVVKAQARRKSSIPRKYNLPSTSNLSAEVKEQSNRFDFELAD
jgi:hypothetical protein